MGVQRRTRALQDWDIAATCRCCARCAAARPAPGNLDLLLQQALTPYAEGRPERRYGGRVFRAGDKVTQLRNNYDKGGAGVFNGTVGVVTAMSLEEHTLTVRTEEDESVHYGFGEVDELAHACAVTIHRSQGGEYPAVVIPAHHRLVDDAAAQPAVHRRDPGQETGRAGRVPPGPWPPPSVPRAPAAATPPWPTGCSQTLSPSPEPAIIPNRPGALKNAMPRPSMPR